MNPFTKLVWDVITDYPEFLEQLTAIMKREYKPFLADEQAFQANAKMLECYIREGLDKQNTLCQPCWSEVLALCREAWKDVPMTDQELKDTAMSYFVDS